MVFATAIAELSTVGNDLALELVAFALLRTHHLKMPLMRRSRRLRPGDVVEVRSAAEILATFDSNDSLEAVPFMPEMLRYVGRRFSVSRCVEKICDTAEGTATSRRMRRTVLLEDLRCDGSAHGGCQAGCRLYWKEAWLRRVDPQDKSSKSDERTLRQLESRAVIGTTTTREPDGADEVYRCQATEAPKASEPLHKNDVRQYVRELLCGNVGLLRLLRVAARAFSINVQRRLGLLGYVPLPHGGKPTTGGEIGLRPGDVVQIRSQDEIAATLDEKGNTRGLSFDWEMVPYCGGTHRVQARVERLIDEATGRMIELSSDCVILEGVVCSGEHSSTRWFCPRGIYPFWREAWLRRVDGEAASTAPGGNAPDAEAPRADPR